MQTHFEIFSDTKHSFLRAHNAMPKYELFNYWRSSCSWRVRIALAWKGLEYEYRPVNIVVGGEQQQDAFRKMSPNQRVPVLRVDGHVLAQSGAILEYLEEAHPEKPLLPPASDLLLRAQVRNLCGIIGCDTQPAQTVGMSAKVADLQAPANAEERQALVVAWNKHWIERGLQAFEGELARCAGRYCVGDEVTLADVYLLPQVYNARLYSVIVAEYPTITRVVGALEQLPAFASSRPDKQVDAPK